MLLVVVTAGEADRVSEGLRAGLGLGLRGDPVQVLLVGPAARFAGGGGDARIERALGTLDRLGRPARVATAEEAQAAAEAARAVEVWTSPGARRRLVLRGPAGAVELDPRAVDSRTLAAQILEADAAFVL